MGDYNYPEIEWEVGTEVSESPEVHPANAFLAVTADNFRSTCHSLILLANRA